MDAAPHTGAPVPWPAWALLAAAGVVVAAAVFAGAGSGGGAVPALGLGAVVVAVATVALASARRLALPRLDRVALAALVLAGAVAAWAGLTIAWSIAGDRSWEVLNRGLLYVVVLGLGLALGALATRTARGTGTVLALVLGAALAWALAGKAVPALFPDGDRAARLRDPVGYWNVLALLADAAMALGLWVATAPPTRRAARVAGTLLAYAAVLALLLTASRAGVVGALVVLLAWAVVARERLAGALVAVCAGLPALAVAAWAFTRPALTDDGVARAERADDGALFAVAAVAGAAVAVVLAVVVAPRVLPAVRRRADVRTVTAAAAAAAVTAVAVLALAVGNPASWAWNQFAGGGADVNDPSRLTSLSSNNRSAWWGEALDVWRSHRLAGSGAGTFEIARKRYRDDATSVTEPHSTPLQLLADGGAVGLLLGVAAAAALVVAVVRGVRRLDGPEREAAAALVALPAAWLLHALVDYDLDFAAATVPMLVAAGAVAAAGLPPARRPHPWLVVPATAVALLVAGSLLSPWLAARELDRAVADLEAGRIERAGERARRAQGYDPLSLEPLVVRAQAAERAGDLRAAAALWEQGVDRQPANPAAWIELGLFRLDVLQDECGAYQALNEAYTRDPNGRQWQPGGPLDVARDAVNAGACER
jgi:O-antigen ligase